MKFEKIYGVAAGLLICDAVYAWAYFSYAVSEQTAWMMVLLNALFAAFLALKAKKKPKKAFAFEEKLKVIENEEKKKAVEKEKKELVKERKKLAEEKHRLEQLEKKEPEKAEEIMSEKEAEYEATKAEIEQAIKEAEFRYMKRKIDETTFRELIKDYNRELVRLEAKHKIELGK